ncbi:MAG: hypothetical protein JW726_19770 [Anaerolineales bacterium]|nr:hypothetical protein [Anaerolineales bacterium]
MNPCSLDRETILSALKETLEPLDYVYAMWEGGAAAFGRVDQWSDIDVQFDVQDGLADDVFARIEQKLASLSPIDLKLRTPSLPWPGIFQWFYRLKDAGPYLLIDTAIIDHSASEKLLQPEIHGEAVFYFDKKGVANLPPLDWEAWNTRLAERKQAMRVNFDMFQSLTLKEINRGNWLEAFGFYQAYTLRPLVEALRMRYAPARYNFHTRYVYYELPPEVVKRLESLYFASSGEQIRQKRQEAEQWFYTLLE